MCEYYLYSFRIPPLRPQKFACVYVYGFKSTEN